MINKQSNELEQPAHSMAYRIVGLSTAVSTSSSMCNVIQFCQPVVADKALPEYVDSVSSYIDSQSQAPDRFRLLEEARKRRGEKLCSQSSRGLDTIRLSCGLSQSMLAEKVGTAQARISRIENGTEVPSILFCRKLAEAFGVSLDEIAEAIEAKRALTLDATETAKEA